MPGIDPYLLLQVWRRNLITFVVAAPFPHNRRFGKFELLSCCVNGLCTIWYTPLSNK